MKRMKKNSRIGFALSAVILLASSCNNWLDELPDKRATLDTPEKIAELLVTAYQTEMPVLMFELMSDNYTDNGPRYQLAYSERTIEESYFFRDVTDLAWDAPQTVWQNGYGTIATANIALQAIYELNNPAATAPLEGEALLCRAYAHFNLALTFCRAYNPETSGQDPGIPYVEEPETTVVVKRDRGTVADTYARIAGDIENGLPLIEDHYDVPKFHFNRKAAYAFAARFFLFYGEYEKAAKYATEAIGENPSADMRNLYDYNHLSQPTEQSYKYHNADERNNLMILPLRSLWGRIYSASGEEMRYGHPNSLSDIVYRQLFPWGGTSHYGSNSFSILWQRGSSGMNGWAARCLEIFEFTNPVTGSGQPHIVLAPFTIEETLMVRAEARAMLDDPEGCARDLSIWYMKNGGSACSAETISEWYARDRDYSPRYKMNSRFIRTESQENLVRAVLAVRRIEGMSLGMRFPDIKRHGIEVQHVYYTSSTDTDVAVLEPYDLRTAIQLPADVIFAGMEANPR